MKSSRIQFILALVLFLVALVLYVFWYESVAAASKDASTLASSISAASTASEEAQEARSAESGLGQSESAVDQYFLADADVVPFLQNMQSLGASAGATVQVVSVGSASATELAVALHITGTFDEVARAAGSIEYAPYDLTEQSLMLVDDGKNAWHADLVVDVGARTAASSTPAVSAPPSAGGAATPAPTHSGSPATQPL